MTSFYSNEELKQLGFKSIGKNCLISRKASFYGISRINIGNNVRVDDFCTLSAGYGGINIGNYIHIAVYSSIQGAGNVTLNDFSNISSRVSIYSSNDDYTGEYMTNPMVPEEYTGVTNKPVLIGRHVIIGCNSVILPGVRINEGVSIGALSLINKDCESFWMYAGCPAKKIKERKRNLLELEKTLIEVASTK